MTAPADERLVWPEQWAVQAMVDAGRIEHRMRVALAAVPRDDRRDQSEQAVRRHLAEARAACRRRSKRRWRTVRDRWRGTSVEQAYRNLHAAKIFLVDLVADADVDVQVAEVSARMGLVLDRNDPRRTEFEKALQSTDPAVRRAAMKQAMETAYDASDERYARLRDFRN